MNTMADIQWRLKSSDDEHLPRSGLDADKHIRFAVSLKRCEI
jgi:hypothetical protein